MRRRKKYGAEEINLTPLLDVLFTVLFIVMLAGTQQQAKSSKETQDMQGQMDRLQEQVSSYESMDNAYTMYASEAVILSVDNIKRGEQHILRINNSDSNEMEEIVLGINSTESTKKRIDSYIEKLVEAKENQPVYIVFTCDEYNIYKIEYDAIDAAFKELERSNKEVFYK